MNTLNVMPLLRIPWNAPYAFTYRVPDDIAPFTIGTIVRIPFRSRITEGIVTGKSPMHTHYVNQTHALKEILAQAPFIPFPPRYIKSCEAIAHATLNHPSRFITPNLIRKELPQREPHTTPPSIIQRHSSVHLHWWYTREECDETIIARARMFAKRQHLILVPTLSEANACQHMLTKQGLNAEIITGKTPPRQRSAITTSLLSGKCGMIIGIRSALFLPFTDLAAITLDDEENPSYKQSAPPPRYHARRVINIMCGIYGVNALLLSGNPSVDALVRSTPTRATRTRIANFQKKDTHSVAKQDRHSDSITLIDLALCTDKQEPFTHSVVEKITLARARNESVVILTAQHGYAPVLACRDCRYVFRCPTCRALLAQTTATADLHCGLCGYDETVPPLCPQCNGSRLTHMGFGEKRLFEYARTMRWGPEAINASSSKNHGCFIGKLSATLSSVAFPTLTLVVLHNADPLLTRSSFSASEHAWHAITRLIRLTRATQAELILQTSAPDHTIFRYLNTPDLFYNEEIALRKQFNYPPFSQFVHITLPSRKGSSACESAVHALSTQLRTLGIEVSAIASHHRRTILSCSFTLHSTTSPLSSRTWNTISEFLKRELPGNAVIDVDPDRI